MLSKGNHKQSKKTTLRMGENVCKQSNRQRINFQNIQIAHEAQYQKKKKIKKWEKDLNRYLSKNIQLAKGHMNRCLTSLIIQFSSVQSLSRVRL